MNRILIIHRGSLGDFLLLLPSIATIRRRFPSARIEILGRPEILTLVCPGLVDSIGAVERAEFLPLFEQDIELKEEVASYFSSFDAVLAFVSDPEKSLSRNLSGLGIENVIVRPPFPPAGIEMHVGEYLLSTIKSLLEQGCGATTGVLEQANLRPARLQDHAGIVAGQALLAFDNDEVSRAEAFLKPIRSQGKPVVAISPGSGSERKCWPVDRYEALVRKLNVEMDCSIMMILGPADERPANRVREFSGELNALIAQSLPLRHLAAALSRCAGYIGNDSGITHLAASTGIPTLAIFGPTDPGVWAPQGKHVRVIRSDVGCSPCAGNKMRRCEDRTCLTGIDAQDVAQAMARELGRWGRGRE